MCVSDRKTTVCLTGNQLKLILIVFLFHFCLEKNAIGLCLHKSSNMTCVLVLNEWEFNICSVFAMQAEDFYFVKWRDIRWRHSSKMAAGGSGEDAFQTFYTEVRLKEQYTHYTHIQEQNRVNIYRWEAASHTHTGCVSNQWAAYLDNTIIHNIRWLMINMSPNERYNHSSVIIQISIITFCFYV